MCFALSECGVHEFVPLFQWACWLFEFVFQLDWEEKVAIVDSYVVLFVVHCGDFGVDVLSSGIGFFAFVKSVGDFAAFFPECMGFNIVFVVCAEGGGILCWRVGVVLARDRGVCRVCVVCVHESTLG